MHWYTTTHFWAPEDLLFAKLCWISGDRHCAGPVLHHPRSRRGKLLSKVMTACSMADVLFLSRWHKSPLHTHRASTPRPCHACRTGPMHSVSLSRLPHTDHCCCQVSRRNHQAASCLRQSRIPRSEEKGVG